MAAVKALAGMVSLPVDAATLAAIRRRFIPGRNDLEKGGSFLLTARSFLLTVGLCYLRWSFLLTVEIWFGLFYLRLKFGLVFFAYGGKSVWSFLLTVPLVQKIGFGLFYLRFP